MSNAGRLLAATAGIAFAGSVARGQCPVLSFSDLPANTAVTTQYDGVTFSVQEMPGSCGASYGRIVLPAQGTASPIKAVCVDGGTTPNPPCEFHPQWLRMVFDNPIHRIEFTVGPGNAGSFQDYTIRAYTTSSGGGGLVSTTAVTDAGNGVFRTVSLTFASNVRRVEIEGINGLESMGIECIDDLAFRFDDTRPTADITSPVGSPASREICACDTVPVRGVVCDEDGAYEHDQLEYRRSGEEAWQFAGSASVAVCEENMLYNWNTSSPAIEDRKSVV